MKILVAGSAGHLGEALMRTLRARRVDVGGLASTTSTFGGAPTAAAGAPAAWIIEDVAPDWRQGVWPDR